MRYLLDTNAYVLLFRPDIPDRKNLLERIQTEGKTKFCISLISSLELHSVLGKWYRRRPQPKQTENCQRTILSEEGEQHCPHTWILPKKKRLGRKQFHDIRKAVLDLEKGRTSTEITLIPLNEKAIQEGTRLLFQYGNQFNFASHDAIIAGTLITEQKQSEEEITLITSDKGLKAVLTADKRPFFDPKNRIS